MNPLLLPLRVAACAFDRAVLARTGDDGASVRYPWSSSPPDYKCFDPDEGIKLEALWNRRFVSTQPPHLAGRDRAILLSFAPPGAWGHMVKDGDSRSAPALPDRFLVVRVARTTHDAKGWVDVAPEAEHCKAWVLDAGVLPGDNGSAKVLVPGVKSPKYQAVGRVFDLCKEPTTARGAVTLNAFGSPIAQDLTFAAFAPAHENNLGFTDTLADLPKGARLADLALSYFVVGWYREPDAHDPLARLRRASAGRKAPTDAEVRAALGLDDPIHALRTLPRTEGERRALLVNFKGGTNPLDREVEAELARRIDDQLREVLGLPPGAPVALPALGDADRCVFHGMVAYIDYWNPRSYLGPAVGAPGADPIHDCSHPKKRVEPTVGFGETAEQAMARAIADVAVDKPEDEDPKAEVARFVTALLDDTLHTWDLPDAADRRRHAERATNFLAVRGGTEWVVVPADENPPEPSKKGPERRKEAPKKKPELNDEHRALLAALDESQRVADEAARRFATAAETLYAAFWMVVGEIDDDDADATRERLGAFVKRWAKVVSRLKREALDADGALAKRIAKGQEALVTALDKSFGPGVFVLRPGERQPFALPKEPVLALRGMGPIAPRHRVWACGRRLADVASGVDGGASLAARAPLAATVAALGDAALGPTLQALATEAALAEAAVAALYRGGGDGPLYHGKSSQGAWVERMRDLELRLGGAVPLPRHAAPRGTERGVSLRVGDGPRRVPLGDVCAAWGQQPWSPLFLDWDATFRGRDAKPRRAQGRTVLAFRPQRMVASRIARLTEVDLGPELSKGLKASRNYFSDLVALDVVAQSLGGLHQQLMQRDDALPRVMPETSQPEYDPDPHPKPKDAAFGRLRALVEDASLAPPASGRLAATTERDGTLSIDNLWVIDTFGQVRVLDAPTMNVPRSLTRVGAPREVGLERRLLEPMRLRVEFARKGPARSVTSGFVLPSLLDRSLVLYSHEGAALGVIARVGKGAPALRPLVAGPARKEKGAGAPLDVIEDATLADFARGLTADSGERFDALMELLDEGLMRTFPPGALDGASPAAVLGRALALVTVDVDIERAGGAAVDPAWLRGPAVAAALAKQASTDEAFEAEVLAALKAAREETPARHVAVRVGCREVLDDGVLGYWVGSADGAIRRTAKLEVPPKKGRDTTPGERTLRLEVPRFDAAPKQRLVLLMDPHGRVYLEPEALPVTSLPLPPDGYQASLRRLPAVLKLAPVLVASNAELRALLGDEGAGAAQALALPIVSAETRPQQPGAAARLSLRPSSDRLLSVEVKPPGAEVTVPDVDVAAVDGLLLM